MIGGRRTSLALLLLLLLLLLLMDSGCQLRYTKVLVVQLGSIFAADALYCLLSSILTGIVVALRILVGTTTIIIIVIVIVIASAAAHGRVVFHTVSSSLPVAIVSRSFGAAVG